MVLQLDDDIVVQEEALEALVAALSRLGLGNALAPVFHVAQTGRCTHEISSGFHGWLMNLFTFAVCGAPWGVKRMGVMTAIGTSYGVDSNRCGSKPFETQWLPGGCVLCFREDVIEKDFFPFGGKAFCEDLMHSFLRIKQGMRLWVIPTARCLINSSVSQTNPALVLAEINARRHFVQLSGGPGWRLALYENLSRLKRQVRSLNLNVDKWQ